ncbi:DUF5330 domain-containing protein [Tianweitania sp. BSSL-BM11]|uniref:DUF5330 domain-containing protein n=1 Tax=Tianweitania aestuarii TaxID=2814886 RepID=A0ABS5RSB0_9HYPH|nr:DUF5330 domain-containing protein [Tianweitania aestuarii]MBS9719869.1 DUF5330 domain-containing protein [Tianweitania aestuarii]
MTFLLRIGFWFSLVLLALPFGFGGEDSDAPSVGPIQTFFAAKEAMSDVAGLCERKPDVCETGRAAFDTISVRARESARLAIEMVDPEVPETHAKPPVSGAPAIVEPAAALLPAPAEAAPAVTADSFVIPVPSARPLDAPHS